MEIFSSGRSSRCLWSSLVTATFVLCFVFVYISFSAESKYSTGTRNSGGYPRSSGKLTEEECVPVCDSKECLYQSKILLDNVQETLEPCEDFYKFSCGGFLDKSGPEEISLPFGSRYVNQMWKKFKNILESLKTSPNSATGKMKTVYDSCIKYGSSEHQAVSTILQLLNSFGIQGWPYLAENYKFVDSSIASVIPNFLLYGEYSFVHFSMETSYRELKDQNSKINLTLRIAESTFEKKEQSVRKFEVGRILNYFSLDSETINSIWEDSEAILDAIMNLKEESERIDDRVENSTVMCENCMDCTRDAGGEWKDLCESLESFINITGVNKTVNMNNANIENSELYFVENIFRVLRSFSDRAIANYLVLNVFLNHLTDLNFYFRLLYQKDPKAHNLLGDIHEPISRWQFCVHWISSRMSFPLAYEFMKTDSTVSVLREVQNLTKELIRETAETVSHQEWLSDDALKDLTEMTERTQDVTGLYERFFPNETNINGLFEEFQPSKESFIGNVLLYGKFLEVQEMRGIPLSDTMHFIGTLLMPGASGGDGELSIQFGILLPPTYMTRLKRLINLASLGTIIVHEIGHSVQSYLQIFMASDQSVKDYYAEKQQCLKKQFSQFRMESIGKNLNGSKYSHENEADNMAVPIIDKLIDKYVSSGEGFLLPGLSGYSAKQLLYISAAQHWCSVYTREADEQTYQSGFHSPANFRLLGMMQNSKAFSKAFSCPDGSNMNPSVKCLILTESD